MVDRLTFKQYLDSKAELREAVKQTPKQSKSYTVQRYCSFVIGESKDERQTITLRPNASVVVDWLYEDIDNPIPLAVSFGGLKNNDPIDNQIPAWTSHKVQKWLMRNATED